MRISIKKILNYSLIVSIYLLVVSCTSELNEGYDLNTKSFGAFDYNLMKLNGRVRSIEFNIYNQNDSLIDSKSYNFNKRNETINYKFNDINGSQVQEINLYNNNGTRISHESYKNGKLIKKETAIDSLDVNGKVAKRSTYNNEKNLINILIYSYLSNGELSSVDSKQIENGESSKMKYIYDDNSVLREDSYYVYDKNSIQIKNINRKFNSLGKPTLEEMYDQKDSLYFRDVFHYDSLDNLVEHFHFLSDTNFYWKRQINYSKEGLKIDSICHFYWSPNPKQEEIRIHNEEIHEFDENKNIIKQTFRRDNKLISNVRYKYSENNIVEYKNVRFSDGDKWEIEYDKYGNQILKQFYDNKIKIAKQEKYVIEYDLHENISKVIIQKDGAIQKTIVRKYEYY